MTETAWKSGIRRGRPGWPIRISVWTEPGRCTTRIRRLVVAAAVDDLAAARRPNRRSVHVAEQLAGHRDDVLAAEVAADHERRPGRVHRALVGAPQRVGIEPLDGLARAARRPVVRAIPARRSCR